MANDMVIVYSIQQLHEHRGCPALPHNLNPIIHVGMVIDHHLTLSFPSDH